MSHLSSKPAVPTPKVVDRPEPLGVRPKVAWAMIGVSPSTGWNLVREGKLPVVRIGHLTIIMIDALRDLLAQHTVSSSTADPKPPEKSAAQTAIHSGERCR